MGSVKDVRKVKVRELFQVLDSIEEEMVVFTEIDFPMSIEDDCFLIHQDEVELHEDKIYFLEVPLIKEMIAVWEQWRNGKKPSLEEKLDACNYYSKNDSFKPA